MAPTPEIVTVEIVPWPRFTGLVDGRPAIGSLLYTFAPETSTPKASYVDPFFVTANTNPVRMDDQGSAYVYLDGLYHLRFTDAAGVLYWEVDNYAFASGAASGAGGVVTGTTEATVSAAAGTGLLTVPGMAPAGYRVLGVTTTITTAFGTSQGLSALLIGDNVLADRWANTAALTAGSQTNQGHFQSGDCPIVTVAYSVLIAALGGRFDATGTLHLTTHWQGLAVDTP
jgi:hypothetical protein